MVLDFIEILKVIFLGIVEGITEWLPISSTGHRILVDEFITLNMSEAFKEMLRLKKLSKKDLELLTLLFVDGYRQIDVARLWHCSRSAVAQRFKKIKKFLNNT